MTFAEAGSQAGRPAAEASGGPQEALFQADFPPDEFAARRARIFDAIGPAAHALVQGAGPVRGFEIFRQTNEFYYCSGVEEPQAYLLLSGPDRRTTLYLPHRPEGRSAEGASLAAEDADLIRRRTGVDAVFGPEALAEHLRAASVLYLPHSPAEGRCGATSGSPPTRGTASPPASSAWRTCCGRGCRPSKSAT